MTAQELEPEHEPIARIGGPSDAALVLSARAGESWASEALYRRHVVSTHRLTQKLLGRDTDVDDILQESFIDAFSSLDRLVDPNAFRAWVASIAVRKTCKLLRRRRLLSRLGLRRPDEPFDLDRLMSRTAPPDVTVELRAVYRIVEGLPTDVRIAFLLRRVEGLTLENIAELTGASLATVKRRVAKGVEMLATAMELQTQPQPGMRAPASSQEERGEL
jgi:RNA polymerase sigma-70 factor, ECF subfamily